MEDDGAEAKKWAAPPNPVCSRSDHTSLRLEWPKYVDSVDGSEYCLYMGFKTFQKSDPPGKRPGKKNAGNGGGGGSADLIQFTMVSCWEFFPDGFRSSSTGHCMNFDGIDWKPVYHGVENSHKADGLRPGMGYVFRLSVILPDSCLKEEEPSPPPLFSDQVMFFTLPCAPDPPNIPILVDRGRTSLKLKWSSPLVTGGMAMSEYLFEMKRPGRGFEVVYSGGTNLSAKVTRLVPGTTYIFRLKASSCLGWSDYSKEVAYSTASSVPAAPPPPRLVSSSPNSISLSWEEPEDHGSPVSSYTVETDNGLDGLFSVCYNGANRSCEVGSLKSGASYKFRVLAHNGVGKGAFSAPATLSTLHSPPSAPRSLSITGRTTSAATICWNPPDYNGGSSITGYDLEVKLKTSGASWTQAYTGQVTTCNLYGLRAGWQYRVRVRAQNNEGYGDFSHEATFTTSPGVSEAPYPPRFSDIQSTSLKVSWNRPDHDGGSPVTAYRLEMVKAETTEFVCAYRGVDGFTEVDNLLPGQKYIFKVQALNKAGSSAWSDNAEIWTKPSTPDAPEPPAVDSVSSTTVSLRWKSPNGNGSSTSSYRVRMAVLGYKAAIQQADMIHLVSSGTDHYLAESAKEADGDRYHVQIVYDGPAVGYTVKKLQPCTSYAFFLQALNSVGESPCSKITLCVTSPCCPSLPAPPVVTETLIDTLSLQWELPDRDNGGSVTSFELHMKSETDDSKEKLSYKKSVRGYEWTEAYKGLQLNHTITSLLPGHSYLFRLVANNAYGPSPPSYLTCSTLAACPLPPSPPTFSGVSPTSVRVKWSAPSRDNGAPTLRYKLLMDHLKPGHLQKVYEGGSTSYKVLKLSPGGSYQAAVQAINAAGTSHLSDLSSVTLPPQIVLPVIDAPQLAASSDSLSVSWKPLDLKEVVSYTLQMESAPGKLLQVYEGSTPRFDISASNPGCKFRVRANGGPDVSSGPWSAFSTWTRDSIQKKSFVADRRTSTGGIRSIVRDMRRSFTDPWSVKQRKVIALAGTFVTLMLALLANSLD